VLGSLLSGGVFQMMFEILHEFHPQSFVVWVATSYVDLVYYLLGMVQGPIVHFLTFFLFVRTLNNAFQFGFHLNRADFLRLFTFVVQE